MKESRTRAALAALTLMAIVGPGGAGPSFTPRSAPPRQQRAVVALTSKPAQHPHLSCSRLKLSGFSKEQGGARTEESCVEGDLRQDQGSGRRQVEVGLP
jgi:hypothetical protein